jgi:hypothetical protein
LFVAKCAKRRVYLAILPELRTVATYFCSKECQKKARKSNHTKRDCKLLKKKREKHEKQIRRSNEEALQLDETSGEVFQIYQEIYHEARSVIGQYQLRNPSFGTFRDFFFLEKNYAVQKDVASWKLTQKGKQLEKTLSSLGLFSLQQLLICCWKQVEPGFVYALLQLRRLSFCLTDKAHGEPLSIPRRKLIKRFLNEVLTRHQRISRNAYTTILSWVPITPFLVEFLVLQLCLFAKKISLQECKEAYLAHEGIDVVELDGGRGGFAACLEAIGIKVRCNDPRKGYGASEESFFLNQKMSHMDSRKFFKESMASSNRKLIILTFPCRDPLLMEFYITQLVKTKSKVRLVLVSDFVPPKDDFMGMTGKPITGTKQFFSSLYKFFTLENYFYMDSKSVKCYKCKVFYSETRTEKKFYRQMHAEHAGRVFCESCWKAESPRLTGYEIKRLIDNPEINCSITCCVFDNFPTSSSSSKM